MNMRAHKKQLIEWILLVVFWLSVIPGWSQEKTPFAEENTYITVSGVVKDKQNRKTLEYVNVSVPGRSVGTVTNADGEFSLKIEDAEMRRAHSAEPDVEPPPVHQVQRDILYHPAWCRSDLYPRGQKASESHHTVLYG